MALSFVLANRKITRRLIQLDNPQASYRTTRPLSDDLAQHINIFKAANNLMLAISITGHGDNPLIRSYRSGFIAKQLAPLKDHFNSPVYCQSEKLDLLIRVCFAHFI
ncbi:MAG: hypothetical protein OSB73_01420 [Candidatus Latescibacteria bacterium]|nr:hypothetical protein [Candidatus Latescibacterota bacterium]